MHRSLSFSIVGYRKDSCTLCPFRLFLRAFLILLLLIIILFLYDMLSFLNFKVNFGADEFNCDSLQSIDEFIYSEGGAFLFSVFSS